MGSTECPRNEVDLASVVQTSCEIFLQYVLSCHSRHVLASDVLHAIGTEGLLKNYSVKSGWGNFIVVRQDTGLPSTPPVLCKHSARMLCSMCFSVIRPVY
jgi:hypothetical protein